MAFLKVIYQDDPASRDDIKDRVIATAQRLGFDHRELTHNGTEKYPDRMMIRVRLNGLTVAI